MECPHTVLCYLNLMYMWEILFVLWSIVKYCYGVTHIFHVAPLNSSIDETFVARRCGRILWLVILNTLRIIFFQSLHAWWDGNGWFGQFSVDRGWISLITSRKCWFIVLPSGFTISLSVGTWRYNLQALIWIFCCFVRLSVLISDIKLRSLLRWRFTVKKSLM